MSSKMSGYASLAAIGALMISLMVGGLYYATPSTYQSPTGRGNYFGNQFGGKKTRKQTNRDRKTRRK